MTEDEVERAFDTWLAGERRRQETEDVDYDGPLAAHAFYECCGWIGWKAAFAAMQGAASSEAVLDSAGPIPLTAQDQPVGDGSPWAGGNGPEPVVPWRPYHNGVRIVGGSHAGQRIAVPADGPSQRLHIGNEEYRLDTAPDGELIYRQAKASEPMSWPYPDGPELHFPMSRQVARAVCPCLHWAADMRTAVFPNGHHEMCDGHGNRKDNPVATCSCPECITDGLRDPDEICAHPDCQFGTIDPHCPVHGNRKDQP